MMLHEFIRDHHDEIVERTRVSLASRRVPLASDSEIASGAPIFLAQLVGVLREQQDHTSSPLVSTSDERATAVLGEAADRRGDDMLRAGLSVAQVIEGYGDVCQAITDEAIEHKANITPDEYRTLNLCLDIATARAVTASSRRSARTRRSPSSATITTTCATIAFRCAALVAATTPHIASTAPTSVMTSPATHEATRRFFSEHNRFGLPEDDLASMQATEPSTLAMK